MIPQLTDEQRESLHLANDAGPVEVVDPTTQITYVLLRADLFREFRESNHDFDPRITYPSVDAIMAEDDADDPLLASYQDDAFGSWN